MKKIFIEIAYWIGCFLIGFAKVISGVRSALFMMIAMAIVMGVAALTMIGFVDLITPELNTLGNVYWDIIVVVIGGTTMWFGYNKMLKTDNEKRNI